MLIARVENERRSMPQVETGNHAVFDGFALTALRIDPELAMNSAYRHRPVPGSVHSR